MYVSSAWSFLNRTHMTRIIFHKINANKKKQEKQAACRIFNLMCTIVQKSDAGKPTVTGKLESIDNGKRQQLTFQNYPKLT